MDINITKKRRIHYKRYIALGFLLLVIVFAVKYLWYLGQADISVDKDSLVFGEVKRGDFIVTVRGNGVLVPDNVQWLSASIEGKVERLEVKAGNLVSKGDLIVELSNPQLVQQLAEAQWELEAMEAEFKAAQIALESAFLQQESSVLNAKLNYESSLLTHNAHVELINQSTGAVSKIVYEKALLEKDQFKQRWLISQKRLDKMKENLLAQNDARAARLNKARKNVERVQQQVDNLRVTATMDSVVLETPLKLGQRVSMGANIAKLAKQDSLIAELQVPEIQIRDVAVGQNVLIDTRNNKIEGVITRVDPAVINGNVQVDVSFSGKLPSDARPDLSVDGEITISRIADTLFVERPLFSQSKSRSSLYKLIDSGKFIERVEVTLGYGSVNKIQIIDGLGIGDKIITSDPTRYESYEKIRIN